MATPPNPSCLHQSTSFADTTSRCWRKGPANADMCHSKYVAIDLNGPQRRQTIPLPFVSQRASPSPRQSLHAFCVHQPPADPPSYSHSGADLNSQFTWHAEATGRQLLPAPVALPTYGGAPSAAPPVLWTVVHMSTQINLCPRSPTQGLYSSLVPSPLSSA